MYIGEGGGDVDTTHNTAAKLIHRYYPGQRKGKLLKYGCVFS